MKSKNYFYNPNKKKVKDLLEQLSNLQINSSRQKYHQIIALRKNKIKQIRSLRSHQILQPPTLPTKNLYPQFQPIKPLSIEDQYLLEKKRLSLLFPDKVFSSQPNLKCGPMKISTPSPFNDKMVINGKFAQYDRLVNEQTGSYKKAAIKNKKQKASKSLHQGKKLKIILKSTFFQKYQPDNLQVYEKANHSIQDSTKIFELTSYRKKSQEKSQFNSYSPQKRQYTNFFND